jgi:hypothetical protein
MIIMKLPTLIFSLSFGLLLPPCLSPWLPSSQAADSLQPQVQLTGKKWVDMNYGPYLTASLQVAPGNIAYKGIVIRLNDGPGGVSKGNQFVVFDTDTLRYAAAWTGNEFIDWRSIVYDGSHGTHPSIVGKTIYTNPVGPGWSHPVSGSWEDQRIRGRDKKPYGPLPRKQAHWKGLYLHQNKVLLSYSVGDSHILEQPGIESFDKESMTAWTRTMNIGPRSQDLTLQIMPQSNRKLSFVDMDQPGSSSHKIAILSSGSPPAPAASGSKFNGRISWEIANPSALNFHSRDFTISAQVKSAEGGTIFAQAPAQGKWQPDHKTLFVQEGHLCFDIGWVGVVRSKTNLDDDQSHHVAVTFDHQTGQVILYIDGKKDAQGTLKPKSPAKDYAVRIGYTSENFPNPKSPFSGSINHVSFFQRSLKPMELARLSSNQDPSQFPGLSAYWNFGSHKLPGEVVDISDGQHNASARSIAHDPIGLQTFDTTVAFVHGGPIGTEWTQTDSGNLRLRIPAGKSPIQLKVLVAGLTGDQKLESFKMLAAKTKPAHNLHPLTKGGPPRWPESIPSKSRSIGFPTGPYAVDSITEPADNPYRSWMRLGGFDFFSDNNRAAVCTWMGDVWIVDGLNTKPGRYQWKRIATGMFQPLGLKIVNDVIYVTCRDQITRLRDLNQDEEIDFYENFNNDAQVTEHFHEFAMDLQTDVLGNFYYAKGARHAKDALVPQHGTLIRISPDGQTSEILARGFRAPNGVCVNGDETFYVSDQEGHWTPKNRINLVRKGGFYGNMMAYHDGLRPYEASPPVTWIHNSFDRSPSEQLWVTSDKWGPLQGSLLNFSYGAGHVSLILRESKEGITQGGVIRMPIPEFPTGIMRGRFHPQDGQLYVCGLFGWAGNKTRPGGFYRVRYTGKPVHMPVELTAEKNGLRLVFTYPLDPDTAGDSESYAVNRWTYRRTKNYGSRDYKVSDPDQTGRDTMEVASATLSDDRKSVFLEIPDLKPVMQMEIKYKVRASDGTRLNHEIQHTVHFLGN